MMSAFVMEAATVLLYPLSLYCKRPAVMPEPASCADADASSALLHVDIVGPHVSLIVFGKLLDLFMSVTPRACALSIHDFFAEPAELFP
jgi:hypothetical protein